MFIQKYKLNNSYTTYVVVDAEEPQMKTVRIKSIADWMVGSKVIHAFHGEGIISKLGHHELAVIFKSSKVFRNVKDVIISYNFINSPKEIENLKLCI